jgi:superfamily II DNA/RNA helicase
MELSFDNLDINDNLLRGIYSYGFEKPSNIQNKSIPIINKGKDVIAQSQSGTGKTGAFTIGALNNIDIENKSVQSIIISPTHELAEQTYEVITNLSSYMKDINIKKVIGKTNMTQSKIELETNPQILVATPGRLLDMINRKYIFTDNIKMLIFDEADEILSRGFMETIYQIIRFLPPNAQILLFSATIPPEILSLTEKFMTNPEQILVNKEELTLEGISQFYINCNIYKWKYDVLYELYDSISINQCIIYINTKSTLINLAERLQEENYPISYIHGELTSELRKKNLEDFKNGQTRILLSTDLLSRGIDIQQLSLVINFDLPKNKETYIHRIGRSGRYGRKGIAINFICNNEMDELDELKKHYNTKIEEMPENISDYIN